MGTPRAKNRLGSTSVKTVRVAKPASPARKRPQRPDSMLHPLDDKGIPLPVKPDTRAPVRPISVRSNVTIGEKTI